MAHYTEIHNSRDGFFKTSIRQHQPTVIQPINMVLLNPQQQITLRMEILNQTQVEPWAVLLLHRTNHHVCHFFFKSGVAPPPEIFSSLSRIQWFLKMNKWMNFQPCWCFSAFPLLYRYGIVNGKGCYYPLITPACSCECLCIEISKKKMTRMSLGYWKKLENQDEPKQRQ